MEVIHLSINIHQVTPVTDGHPVQDTSHQDVLQSILPIFYHRVHLPAPENGDHHSTMWSHRLLQKEDLHRPCWGLPTYEISLRRGPLWMLSQKSSGTANFSAFTWPSSSFDWKSREVFLDCISREKRKSNEPMISWLIDLQAAIIFGLYINISWY